MSTTIIGTGSIKKWGNSASIRLPTSVMEAANLSIDSTVIIQVIDGRIIIQKLSALVDVAQLIASTTDEPKTSLRR